MEVRSLLPKLPEFGSKHRIPIGVMIDYATPSDTTAYALEALEREVDRYFTKEPWPR